MFSRNEAAGNQGQGNRRTRSRSLLRAPIAWALALPVSLVFLLSFAGLALGEPFSNSSALTTSLTGASPLLSVPPTVTSIAPTQGPTTGGTAVTIKGTGFLAGATVLIGAEATGVEVVSETEIKAKTAATSAGSNEVVVEDEGGYSDRRPQIHVRPAAQGQNRRTVVREHAWWDCGCCEGDWVCERRDREDR